MECDMSAELLDFYLYGKLERSVDLDYNDPKHIDKKGVHQPVLPDGLCILPSSQPGSNKGVFSKVRIKPGTVLGQYQGQIIKPSCAAGWDLELAWEITEADDTLLGYVTPTSGHEDWMKSIQCARDDHEQNVEAVQIGSQIQYKVTKEISRGDELLVWYGRTYNLYMGLPILRPSLPPRIGQTHDKQEVSSRWHCVLCKRGFNSRSNLRSHMRIHTLEKPFTCKYCGRHFSQSSTLRNHIRLHTGEKPYRCLQCDSSYSQLAGLRAHQRSSVHRPQLATQQTIGSPRSSSMPNSLQLIKSSRSLSTVSRTLPNGYD